MHSLLKLHVIVAMHFICLHVVNSTNIFITVSLVNILLNLLLYKLFLFLIFVLSLQAPFEVMFPSEWRLFFSIVFGADLLLVNFLYFIWLKVSLFRLHFILKVIFLKHKEYNSIVLWFPFFLLRGQLSLYWCSFKFRSRAPTPPPFRLLSLCFIFSNCHMTFLGTVYLY